jgi:1-deoxy-D-xylulose-5-phosphate synthase
MAPKDEAEMRDMLLTSIEFPGPTALRYPRGNGRGVDITAPPKAIEIGKGEKLRTGGDATIIAYGSMVYPAVEAAEKLAGRGVESSVVNARFVKPLDSEMILSAARETPLIVTVEEAYLAGGFGSAVMELLEAHGLQDKVRVVRMGVADEIVSHGDPQRLCSDYGLDADGIAEKVLGALELLSREKPENRKIRAVK